MSKKAEAFYFNNFSQSICVSCETAEYLKNAISDFHTDTLETRLAAIHELENKGDKVKHDMIQELVKAFITPLERDDIIKLSQSIDDVTDAIEDILIKIYTNEITEIRDDLGEFIDIIISCCNATKKMLEEFHNFRKSKTLASLLIEINTFEEQGDKLYIRALRRLHREETNILKIIAWREIYHYCENACDACEDVADIVESITIGNS